MSLIARPLPILLAAAAGFVLLSAPQQASADTVAGLNFDAAENMDLRVGGAVRGAVSDAFDQVDSWSFLGFKSSRAKMNPIVRDCFTDDCLQKAGQATDASTGLSISISGEAQIYEWEIVLWNLYSGQKLKTRQGSCELCGRAEVERTFRESLKAALIGTAAPRDPSASTTKPGDEPPSPQSTATPQPQIALRISVVPKDATIRIDDEEVGQGDITQAVNPGTYTISLTHEGYQGLRETVVVDPSTQGPVLLRVHLSKTDPEPVFVSGSPGPIDRLGKSTRNLYGGVALGAGAAMLGTGIFLASLDGQPACDPGVPVDECPEIYATGGAGMTLGVLGTAALTSGLTLLVWEQLAGSSDDAETPAQTSSESALRFTPSLGPGGPAVLLHGRF